MAKAFTQIPNNNNNNNNTNNNRLTCSTFKNVEWNHISKLHSISTSPCDDKQYVIFATIWRCIKLDRVKGHNNLDFIFIL